MVAIISLIHMKTIISSILTYLQWQIKCLVIKLTMDSHGLSKYSKRIVNLTLKSIFNLLLKSKQIKAACNQTVEKT